MSFNSFSKSKTIQNCNSKSIQKQYSIREQPIKVYCRVKPIQVNQQSAKIQIRKETGTIMISDTAKNIEKYYSFNRIFNQDETQQRMVGQVCRQVLECAQKQRGSLIFSYGVTNSGKTYTILGNPQEPGILPHLIKNLKKPILITAIEIYNEQFYSLKSRQRLFPKEYGGFIQFKQCTPDEIKDENYENILKQYIQNRTQNDNKMNTKSSRSHAIFKIQSNGVIIGVVDLAGSQRTSKIVGKVEQSSAINKSLLCLGRCIQSLKQQITNPSVQIPYRQSKLTKVLIQYFGPQFNVYMIVNLNKSQGMLHENINVLEYAAVVKDIKHNLSKSTMSHFIKTEQKSERDKSQRSQRAYKLDTAEKSFEVYPYKSRRKQKIFNLNSEIHNLVRSRVKSAKKTNDCDSDLQVEDYEATIKSLNQQIIKILKMKKIDQCISRLEGIQQEVDNNFELAFQKEKEQDKYLMDKLKSQYRYSIQVTPQIANASVNTTNIHGNDSIKQSIKKKLRLELLQQLKKQRLKNLESIQTHMGSSFKKAQTTNNFTNKYEKQQQNPNSIQQPVNQSTDGIIIQALKWPINYMKSSAKKIYDCSSTILDIAHKSSQKIKEKFKKKKQFQIQSIDIFHQKIQQIPKKEQQKRIQEVKNITDMSTQILLIMKQQQTQTQVEKLLVDKSQQNKKQKNYTVPNKKVNFKKQTIVEYQRNIKNDGQGTPYVKKLRSRDKII